MLLYSKAALKSYALSTLTNTWKTTPIFFENRGPKNIAYLSQRRRQEYLDKIFIFSQYIGLWHMHLKSETWISWKKTLPVIQIFALERHGFVECKKEKMICKISWKFGSEWVHSQKDKTPQKVYICLMHETLIGVLFMKHWKSRHLLSTGCFCPDLSRGRQF